jgi:hypothetical protein
MNGKESVYVDDKKQRVKINNAISNEQGIQFGVQN